MVSVYRIFKNQNVRRTVILLGATGCSMVALVCINYFLTKIFTPLQFGNYSFLINLFVLSQLVFNFGFFQSAGRIIAIKNDPKEYRKYYGAGFIIVLLIYIVMFVCLSLYAFFSNNVVSRGLTIPLMCMLPLGWVYLLINFYEQILQGAGQINLLARMRLVPYIVYLIILGAIFLFNRNGIGFNVICVLYLASFAVTHLYIFFKLKPDFSGVKEQLSEIWTANKQYGFHIYIGALFAVGASNLMGVLISYFESDNTPVGLYNMALQISAPLSLIPNIVATVMFKQFANSSKIAKNVVLSMLGISACAFVFISVIAGPFVRIVYGEDYLGAIPLVKYLSIGAVLYGIADFYNRFLLSKGQGKQLRNASFCVGSCLLISGVLLTKYFGVSGAACARIISGTVYVLVIWFYYMRIVSDNKGKAL